MKSNDNFTKFFKENAWFWKTRETNCQIEFKITISRKNAF